MPVISSQVVYVGITCATVFLLGRITYHMVLKPLRWPLRNLPGPRNPNLAMGNLLQLMKSDPVRGDAFEEWAKEYGKVYKFKTLFNEDQLVLMDPRAINHILMHASDYPKPLPSRKGLAKIIGEGVLVTEGEQHKRQRRIMNPAFSPMQIKAITPIFLQKSQQLRDIWFSMLDDEKEASSQTIDVLSWLGRATLDIIGLAGFAYRFDALNVNQKPTELSRAFQLMFNEPEFRIFGIFQYLIPVLQRIKNKQQKTAEQAQETMKTIGRQLIAKRKIAYSNDRDSSKASGDYFDGNASDDENWETWKDLGGRDLLSVLIKANMDEELPESQKLTDDEVLAQIPTFTVAGHETTSTQTTWCLFALCTHSEIQTKLREELLAFPTETPSMDELSALPYLDSVCREIMRLHPAVPDTGRVAMKDEMVPLSEPYKGKDGKLHTSLQISKDDVIVLHIAGINRSKEIWGDDSMEFNPDRWANRPDKSDNVPGVWGNILTFLGGARSCIGYRFALIEMKALLFTLVRAFEFHLDLPVEEVYGRSMVVTRPYLRSEKEKGAQLPLRIRRYVSQEIDSEI